MAVKLTYFSKMHKRPSNSDTSGRKSKKRLSNMNRIYRRVTYTTKEIAVLLEVHSRTVQEWYKAGLERIDDGRPFLVLGEALLEFLSHRIVKRRQECGPGQVMCFRCRQPVAPVPESLRVRRKNVKTALISAVCAQCGAKVNRASSSERLLNTLISLGCDTTRAKNLCRSTDAVVKTHLTKEQT